CGGAYLFGCWGVVQSVGHLTVNEDGGGSNPPAPANFYRFACRCLVANSRQARFGPASPATVHRFHVGIAHFLQIVGHESGAETATTIEDQFGARIGNALLDIALDDPPAHVHGAGDMAFGPLVVFA